jgi:predicted lactoylglutathione lyase
MPCIDTVTLEVADPSAAHDFYTAAFGPDIPVQVRASEAPTSGFRGFTLSLVTSQPANVDALVDSAVAAGATTLKPAAKSLWGYGGMVQAPDGTAWQIVSSSKKNTGSATRQVDDVVLLLGVENVSETKRFYVDRGFSVAKSFGSKYVEFEAASSPVKLALYKRRGLAKLAGVPTEGSGSHRLVVCSDASPFTDPDGFVWTTVSMPAGDLA